MQEQSSFGALLKRYRLGAGLSQEALAARATLSARAISDLERGIKLRPHFETLELLTDALSLPAQQRALLHASARPEMAPAPSATRWASSISSLPLAPTPLIGREQERSRALACLRSTSGRLLTITGPSGVGKTRLALQLAQDLSADFSDGVAFVALAPPRKSARRWVRRSSSCVRESMRTCIAANSMARGRRSTRSQMAVTVAPS